MIYSDSQQNTEIQNQVVNILYSKLSVNLKFSVGLTCSAFLYLRFCLSNTKHPLRLQKQMLQSFSTMKSAARTSVYIYLDSFQKKIESCLVIGYSGSDMKVAFHLANWMEFYPFPMY